MICNFFCLVDLVDWVGYCESLADYTGCLAGILPVDCEGLMRALCRCVVIDCAQEIIANAAEQSFTLRVVAYSVRKN